ncbi:hypothetical protein [Porphyrobacter sp. AAP82]|uniref:hypothetical protein n=1 Tax=Porphyrobacter sp. AAP82 TaxID=1248917 RepID=UPI0012DFAC96|nr:hypothetical protein [Porphyrobacter sp. AAP82]
MTDTKTLFSNQFVSHQDGYLFYPGRKAGGRFVSNAEFQALVAQWQSVAGFAGTLKTVLTVILIIALGMVVTDLFDVGEWAEYLAVCGAVAFVIARVMWASFAPWRRVAGRPDAVPPRPPALLKRQARAMLRWRMIIPVLIVSTSAFAFGIYVTPKTSEDWLWLVGSGAMAATYGWIAIQKYRDRAQI